MKTLTVKLKQTLHTL